MTFVPRMEIGASHGGDRRRLLQTAGAKAPVFMAPKTPVQFNFLKEKFYDAH